VAHKGRFEIAKNDMKRLLLTQKNEANSFAIGRGHADLREFWRFMKKEINSL
jgi:hypothetical protein